MAERHLDHIKDAPMQRGWRVSIAGDGNDYDTSGTWQINREAKVGPLHIDFNGLDDMSTLPVNEAYGCRVRERPDISLYFAKPKTFNVDLEAFIEQLDQCCNQLD